MSIVKNFLMEEDGIGVVEVILILVVLIGLVIIFKEQLTDLVEDIFDTITKEAGKCDGSAFLCRCIRRKNPAGSISVFFAILLPLVCSLFFSMLEVTRIRGLM